jgi:predicted NUDIX family phosphoesterase
MKNEKVLCFRRLDVGIESELPNGFKPGPISSVIREASTWLVPRDHAEIDLEFIQFIPYCLVTRVSTATKASEVLMYTRTKTGSDGRLHGKTSIGFGGHVNLEDLYGTQSEDLYEVSMRCMQREIEEELGVAFLRTAFTTLGTLYDPSNEVGRVHLGMVYTLQSSNFYQLRPPSTEVSDIGFRSLQDVLASEKLEPWSRIVAEYLMEG